MDYNKDVGKKGHRLLGRRGPRDLQKHLNPDVVYHESSDVLLNNLKDQIDKLTTSITKQSVVESNGNFTAEDFDIELNKHITIAVNEVEQKYSKEFNQLEEKILKYISDNDKLKITLQDQENTIKFNNERSERQDSVIKKLENQIIGLEKENLVLEHKVESLTKELLSRDNMIKLQEDTICFIKSKTDDVVNSINVSDRPVMETVFIDPVDKGNEESMVSHIEVKEDIKKDHLNDKVNKLKSLIGSLPR